MRLIDSHRSPLGPVRVLVASSLLFPLLLFAVASWLNYRAALADATRELQHSSEVAREHAAKVFEGQSQVVDRVNDAVAGLDDAAIRASELMLHQTFAGIVARLLHIQSVLLASRDGHPLVSAGVYPVPRAVDLSRRDYFRAVIGGYAGTYISGLQVGDVNRQLFFGLARPWTGADGSLKGVIDVAVAPAYFQDFYKILVEEGGDGPDGKVMTLVRDDGQILVRYPPVTGPPPKAAPDSPFFAAIRANPDDGVFDSHSIVDADAPARIFAYRKVQGYPVYIVAGRSRSTIIAGWQRTMASHLIFGVPATLALFAVTWTVLVRTQREQEARVRAEQEIERRRQAEATLLKAQRLEAVGQMTGGVAHDFNNLLMVILGSAEMAMKRADDPARVRRLVAQIIVAVKRGSEITQQLLVFSGRQSSRPEILDLNQRLQDFKPLLDRAARGAIRVELILESGLYPVRLDPGHCEAAILNLVGNARDAMPDGGTIRITTRNVTLGAAEQGDLPAGRYVRIAVADSGTGMAPETAAKAFEPFFTTKGIGKGTGLGLSQVFGFARQAGGDLRIATALGRGTTVEIVLPAAAADQIAEQAAQPPSPAPRRADGEVVLVVKDEAGVLGVTVEGLHDLGYTTLTAKGAHAALDLLRGPERADVMLSDVVMPDGMTGFQLAAEAMRLRPALKVLLTSGDSAGLDSEASQGIPILAKPYGLETLAAVLSGILRG